ncbi:MAG TPA: MBL fold metallo-hydrolase [Chloroflexota bacterium]|nr:MBL fold metallo-hydrolase [Chloroflexota bacterium]
MPGLEDELGDIVRKARSGLGIEVAQLAQSAGLSEKELKALEVYTFRPNEQQVRALAEALQLGANQLWEIAQDSWSAPEVQWKIGDAFTIDCLTNDYPEHCYVITARSGECLIVDPGAEAERVGREATRDGRRPVGILITHQHQDHTGALVPVQAVTKAPVFIHRQDEAGSAGVPSGSVNTFSRDGEIHAGGITVRTLHTPGHTPGSATYVIESEGETAAFCGDTLFAGSAGNARASYEALLKSLREKLAQLPPKTILYPGHGPQTTVANELQRNPFL